jgi:hypothetical protein
MSLNIRTSDARQAKVYDLSDPDRHGVIVKAGSEVSEVRYDDGALRNVVNDHLRSVEPTTEADELAEPTHTCEPEVTAGQHAWARLRNNSTWEDWKAVAVRNFQ